VERGAEGGFGLTISGANPVRVSRIDPGSFACRSGLRLSDEIVRIDGRSVVHLSCNSVAAIIRSISFFNQWPYFETMTLIGLFCF